MVIHNYIRKHHVFSVLLFVLFFSSFCNELSCQVTESVKPDSLYIKRIQIIDGRGSQGVGNVLIVDGKIALVTDSLMQFSCRFIEGEGKSILPGIIEGHAHISHTPAQNFHIEGDSAKELRYRNRLKSYLAWGVTTIVDPGITVANGRIFRKLEKGGASPRLVFVGPLIGPRHGYPSEVVSEYPGVGSKRELDSLVSNFKELGPIGIKVTMEDGPLMKIWPLFSKEIKVLIDSMRVKGGRKLFIHAMDKKMTKKALKMNPYALVHGSKNGGRKLVEEIVNKDVFVVTTTAIYGAPLLMWHPERLSTYMMKLTVPADELNNVTDSTVISSFEKAFLETVAPGVPLWIGKKLNNEKYVNKKLKGPLKMISKFNEAGVKLVLGSDAGGWPIMPYMLHGPNTHIEIDQLLAAGLTPLEIIRAATITPSEMIGLSDKIGSIEVGKNADLLIVNGDPLQDITLLHEPLFVIVGGRCKTPEQWME